VSHSKIVVAGGYGTVGREIVRVLAPDYPGRVLVGGRRLDEAAEFCGRIGHGTAPRRIDVTDEKSFAGALDGVGTIVCSIDQPERLLLHAAIERGLAYTDIAPHLVSLTGFDELSERARRTGAVVILGAGLSPGISSVLARAGADRVGAVDSIESSVLLGIGDVFGPASLSFVLREVQLPFSVLIAGKAKRAFAFQGSRGVRFPDPVGARRAYLFPFSDAVSYPTTLGATTARAWLALDPPWLGRVVSRMLAAGGRRLLSRAGFAGANRGGLERLKRAYAGRDRFAVLVEVRGKAGQSAHSISGRNQAHATGIGAAEIARALVERKVGRAGLWYAEQVIAPEAFFERLRRHGLDVVEQSETSPAARSSAHTADATERHES
jgi:saccharopine dehydrogenase (NAD+, L-lysine forming)